jgi:hypothetical protein
MIAVESEIRRPSSSRIGNVKARPRLSDSATAMFGPGGAVRRLCSTDLSSSAHRTFSL